VENRGISYFYKKQYDRAIADETQAIRLKPDDIEAFMERGLSYSSIRRFNQSIADFDTVIRIDPRNVRTFTARGASFLSRGEIGKAFADLNHAIDLNPSLAAPYYFRGLLYEGRAQFQQSAAEFDQAIRLDPTFAAALNERKLLQVHLAPPPTGAGGAVRPARATEETHLRCDLVRGHSHCEPVEILILEPARRRVYTDPILGLAQEDDKWLAEGKVMHWGGQTCIEHVGFDGDHVRFGLDCGLPISLIGDLDLNTGLYDNAQGCLLQCQVSKGAVIPH
jgi:Flp pilus assembly protein TadD